MDKAMAAERFPLWKRACDTIDDINFTRHGLLRCISPVKSGRHYLQVTDEIYDEAICHSSYFNTLKSARRMKMVKALEKQSYQRQSEILSSLGIDYLKQFPELDEYRVEAADGHFIQHACHTEKNSKGRVFAAGFIHALNLRDGLLRPLCVVTNGSERHQEIPALRSYIEQRPDKKSIGQKHLYVYDKAVTDFAYRDPETGQLHPFISTLPKSINPGTIAMLYYKRWTIEKVFNHSKSDLTKRKAWSSNLNALNSQMRFTAMAYNIMRVFEEISKARSPERIHPSDKKHHAALNKRQVIAWEKGGFVNPLFFHARIVRVCSFTIRSVQNAIMTGRTLIDIMGSLTRHLKPRVREYSGTLMIRTHIKAVLIIQQDRNVTESD